MRRALFATTLTLLIGSEALARTAPSAPAGSCPAIPVAPPSELAGWSAAQPALAATDPVSAAKSRVTDGKAIEARLNKREALRFVPQPEKAGGSESYGGLFAFPVKTAGTYRIALGAAAWVDVVIDGKAVASTAHGHGPACTGIRKMVDFSLTKGEHLIQIAGSATPTIRLLAVRLP
jgi:hypothetical protein